MPSSVALLLMIPEPDESCPFPLHVDAVSWVEGLTLEEELELGLRIASHQSSETSRHAPETQKMMTQNS